MKRSLLHLCIASLLTIACAVCFAVVERASAAWRTSRDWVVRLAMVPIAMCSARAGGIARQPVQTLTAARSFLARCMRRAEPRIEAQWRMCSSA